MRERSGEEGKAKDLEIILWCDMSVPLFSCKPHADVVRPQHTPARIDEHNLRSTLGSFSAGEGAAALLVLRCKVSRLTGGYIHGKSFHALAWDQLQLVPKLHCRRAYILPCSFTTNSSVVLVMHAVVKHGIRICPTQGVSVTSCSHASYVDCLSGVQRSRQHNNTLVTIFRQVLCRPSWTSTTCRELCSLPRSSLLLSTIYRRFSHLAGSHLRASMKMPPTIFPSTSATTKLRFSMPLPSYKIFCRHL